MNKKTIFILGSNSFSGSHYINHLLDKKHNVVGISRSSELSEIFLPYKLNKNIGLFNFYKLDINKTQDLKKIFFLINKFKPKYIVNFMAQGMVEQSWKKPLDWYRTNFISHVNLINHLKEKNYLKKFVQFSTPEVYGSIEKKRKESINFNPSTPYAVSRAAFDMHLKILHDNYKFPVVITRTANVYGPFQQIYRIIPKTIFCAFNNQKINLDGGGKTTRSFIYIEDVTKVLYQIMIKGKSGSTYHISTKSLISIKNLVKKIIGKINNNLKIIKIVKERIGKDKSYNLSANKIINEFAFLPKINLNIGINKTIDWYLMYKKKIHNNNLNYKHKK